MGILWCVDIIPEVKNDLKLVAWLQGLNLNRPLSSLVSRYPTPNEIRQVLDGLSDYNLTYYVSKDNGIKYLYFETDDKWDFYEVEPEWGVKIEGKEDKTLGTQLTLMDFCGDEDVSHEFYFDRGNGHLALSIVEKLSHFCGPFIFTTDASAIRPILVTPGIDVNQSFEA